MSSSNGTFTAPESDVATAANRVPTPAARGYVHFVMQSKGGVGKSYTAAMLA